jgi:hypothetical protein|tara:strand:+ start:11820 stop:12512 length:693 start_codon:yes stop_codon:yes gene_type:complete
MKAPDKKLLTEEQINQVFDEINHFQVPLETINFEKKLFEGYRNIIVTGAPRSGTTITGKMLAETISFKYVDENEFGCRNFKQFKLISNQGKNVIQAPGISHIAHFLPNDDDLVVFMVRPWSDIVKSLYRILGKLSNWILTDTLYEYELFNRKNPGIRCDSTPAIDTEVEDYFIKHVDRESYYLEMTYKMWKFYQRDKIKNWLQLDFESMSAHPLWIDKKDRKNFTRKQTQ